MRSLNKPSYRRFSPAILSPLPTVWWVNNTHKLYSIKAKSFEKWMEIYHYRKNKPASEPIDYKQLKKKRASLINLLRKIPKI